jgi:hypothetical protein
VAVGGYPIVATPKRTCFACVWDLMTMLATSVLPVGVKGRLTMYRPVLWFLRPRKMVWPSALSIHTDVRLKWAVQLSSQN